MENNFSKIEFYTICEYSPSLKDVEDAQLFSLILHTFVYFFPSKSRRPSTQLFTDTV